MQKSKNPMAKLGKKNLEKKTFKLDLNSDGMEYSAKELKSILMTMKKTYPLITIKKTLTHKITDKNI